MPSAEKKNSMDKQAAAMENVEPIKQAQIVIEHKIRNIEKRKRKIETYREDQAKGQTLNKDQLLAVSKYDEVCNTLVFAQELVKHFGSIAVEAAKLQKKQARKEAVDRAALDTARVKEILIVQDVLKTMGIQAVREDFLAGRNKAVLLTEEELQYLDDFYVEVSPERMPEDDEGYLPFDDQTQSAAEHLVALVEARPKEVAGTTYTNLKELIGKIQASGYLEARAQLVAVEPVEEAVELTEEFVEQEVPEQANPGPVEYYEEPVVTQVVQAMPKEIPQVLQPEPVMVQVQPVLVAPHHRTVNELIDPVTAPFNFLQDSELDAEAPSTPPVAVPPAGPIPTQMYVNQNFAMPVQQPMPVYAAGYAAAPPPIPMPPSHRVVSPFRQPPAGGYPQQQQPPPQQQQQQQPPPPPLQQQQHQPSEYKQGDSQEISPQQPTVQPDLDRGDWSLETEDPGAGGDWIQPPTNRNNYGGRNSRPSNYQNNRGGGGGGGGGGYNNYQRNDSNANSYKNGYSNQREGGGSYGNQREGGNYGNSNYGGNRPRGGQRGGQSGGQFGGGRGNRGYGGGGYNGGQQRQASRQ